LCAKDNSLLSGNKPTDLKAKFHKKYASEKELSTGACTTQMWPEETTVMINSISTLVFSDI